MFLHLPMGVTSKKRMGDLIIPLNAMLCSALELSVPAYAENMCCEAVVTINPCGGIKVGAQP